MVIIIFKCQETYTHSRYLHALIGFNCEEIMVFSGRKLHGNFLGRNCLRYKTKTTGSNDYTPDEEKLQNINYSNTLATYQEPGECQRDFHVTTSIFYGNISFSTSEAVK